MAYNIDHLNWIKNFKNSLFSNYANFYEEYINCFLNDKEETIRSIGELREKIENYYGIKFNFDSNFLYFPNFKDKGKFNELVFNYY